MQRRQITSAMAADPTVAAKYSLGYAECATEVARYLGASHGIDDNVRNRVMNHISSNCASTNQNAAPISNGNYPLQPLHVQIPQNRHETMSLPSDRLLVQFPEQSSDYVFQHSSYPSSHSDMRNDTKTFEPVLLQNGPMLSIPSKNNALRNRESKCDLYSNQNKFMDLIRDSRMGNKSFSSGLVCKPEPSRLRSCPLTPSSVSAFKDESLWRPW